MSSQARLYDQRHPQLVQYSLTIYMNNRRLELVDVLFICFLLIFPRSRLTHSALANAVQARAQTATPEDIFEAQGCGHSGHLLATYDSPSYVDDLAAIAFSNRDKFTLEIPQHRSRVVTAALRDSPPPSWTTRSSLACKMPRALVCYLPIAIAALQDLLLRINLMSHVLITS